MAIEEGMVCRTLSADGDLSASFLEFVKRTSTGVTVCSSQGEAAHGVLQNKPTAAGHAATVAVAGTVKVYAGATIAQGARITTGADGRAEVAATGDFVVGVARTGGADGEIISVELVPSLGAVSA